MRKHDRRGKLVYHLCLAADLKALGKKGHISELITMPAAK